MNIRRIVPIVGQMFRNGHSPVQRKKQPTAPIGKIGKGHHAVAADAQHFVQHGDGVCHSLYGFRHDDGIEAVVGKVGEPVV